MAQTRVACAAQPSSSAHGASIFSKLDQGLPSIEDVLHDIRSEESTLENLANVSLDKLSHYQLRKGPLALKARRISRCSDSAVPHCALGHPGAPKIRPLAFCTLCIDFICALSCLSAFTHYGFILMSQKDPETEPVRDQQ